MSNNNIIIRKFNRSDREEVRKISCDTAFLEEPRKYFFDDDEVLADALTLYFTDYEPDACFVAVQKDKVIGYIIGSKNIRIMWRIFNTRIIPYLMIKILRKGVLFRRNTQRFLMHGIISFIKGEFFEPDFSRQYPATLHINIDKKFRGYGVGRQLIKNYLEFLRREGVRGVHFGTMSESAKIFFTKLGFTLLFAGKRSYLRYYFGKDTPGYIFGKLMDNKN